MAKTKKKTGFIHLPGFQGALCDVTVNPRETTVDKAKVTCPECLRYHEAAVERAKARAAERTNQGANKMARKKKETAEESKAETVTNDGQKAGSDLSNAKDIATKAVQKDHFTNDGQIRAEVEQAGYSVEGLDSAALEEIREACGVRVVKPSGWVSERIGNEWRKSGKRLNPSGKKKAIPSGGKRRGRPPGSGRKAAGDVATVQVQATAGKGLAKQGDPFALARLVSEIQAIMAAHGVSEVTIPRQGMITTR